MLVHDHELTDHRGMQEYVVGYTNSRPCEFLLGIESLPVPGNSWDLPHVLIVFVAGEAWYDVPLFLWAPETRFHLEIIPGFTIPCNAQRFGGSDGQIH